ncbi:MAG TPA: glycosyltransferase family 39 protein [Acidobacteriaceae bacterium]|nr:glycosyltransferase family 39 protein [Acidobacteriaceae bacterium]
MPNTTTQQFESVQDELVDGRAAPTDTPRYLIPLIMLVSLAIRMVVVYFTYRDLPDVDKYCERFGWEVGWVARALASGRGFTSPYHLFSGPTALVPPLYTWLLAGVFRLFGIYSLKSGFIILSINSLFSTLTCIPVYFSAKYSLGMRGARVACLAWAVYPFAIYFSAARVWEYALTTLLFTICFCIAQRIHRFTNPLAWICFGALYGLTALSNSAVLAVLPFLLLLALWKGWQAGRRWLFHGVLAVAGVFIVIAPWTLRNSRVLHVLCPVRDNFWLEFYLGNFGDTSDPNPAYAHPADNPVEMQKYLSLQETAYLAEKHALAVNYVRHHPLFFVYVSLRRVVYYWSGFWSFSHEYMQREPFELPNILFCGTMTLLMLRGARRLWRENRDAALPYFILIAIFPLAYYITHPAMDYRQPIEPAVVVLAIAGWFPGRQIQGSQDEAGRRV